MGIKDKLFGLIDNTGLAEVFNRKEIDPATARKPLLKGIASAKKQFENGQTKAPNRWWKVSNGVVALTVKVQGNTMDINGVATNHMPQERFQEFLDQFKAAVEAGEFDEELANKGNGDAQVHIPRARKASSGGSGGGGRTPLSNARSSISRFITNGRSLEEAEALARANAKGRFSDADVDAVMAERKEAENA